MEYKRTIRELLEYRAHSTPDWVFWTHEDWEISCSTLQGVGEPFGKWPYGGGGHPGAACCCNAREPSGPHLYNLCPCGTRCRLGPGQRELTGTEPRLSFRKICP